MGAATNGSAPGSGSGRHTAGVRSGRWLRERVVLWGHRLPCVHNVAPDVASKQSILRFVARNLR